MSGNILRLNVEYSNCFQENQYSNCKCTESDQKQIMTKIQCLQCQVWLEELRKELVVSNIRDMAQFFMRLLTERIKMDV